MLNFDELAELYGYEIEDEDIQELTFVDKGAMPIRLTDAQLWKNYTDQQLYELDKKFREYLEQYRLTQKKRGGFKTAVPIVFKWMFGRTPTGKDSGICRRLHTLLRYYCTSYTGTSAIAGKPYKHVYHFSKYQAKNKRPCSIRLRLEEAGENATDRTLSEYGEYRDKKYKTLKAAGLDGRKEGYDSHKGRRKNGGTA